MVAFEYLYKGVCGLANAHQAGTMAGHLGAAVATGYFFGEDNSLLPVEVFSGIEKELERVIAGEEAIWFNAQKAGVTPAQLFNKFETEKPQPERIQAIVDALEANIGTLRQSGHNVIFAAAAVRALRDHQQFATPAIVAGIQKLIQAFDEVPQGRGNFGKEIRWKTGDKVDLNKASEFPMYQSIQDMVDITIQELIASAAIQKQGFGGLWHIINHAAAITELDRFGYRKVAQLALPAHHRHVRLWRELPDLESELGAVIKSKDDPAKASYWAGELKRDQARLTHRVKTLFGFHTLKRFMSDEKLLKQAEEAFLFLMA